MQLSPLKLIAPEQRFAARAQLILVEKVACLTNGGGFVPLEPFYQCSIYHTQQSMQARFFIYHAKRCACIPHYPLTWNL